MDKLAKLALMLASLAVVALAAGILYRGTGAPPLALSATSTRFPAEMNRSATVVRPPTVLQPSIREEFLPTDPVAGVEDPSPTTPAVTLPSIASPELPSEQSAAESTSSRHFTGFHETKPTPSAAPGHSNVSAPASPDLASPSQADRPADTGVETLAGPPSGNAGQAVLGSPSLSLPASVRVSAAQAGNPPENEPTAESSSPMPEAPAPPGAADLFDRPNRGEQPAPPATVDGSKPLESTPAQPAAPKRRVYVVQQGDTLLSIARKQLENITRWTEIYRLNAEQIGPDLGRLTVGMELMLPER